MRISRSDLRHLVSLALARQGLGEEGQNANRLLALPVKDILERIWIAPDTAAISSAGFQGRVNAPDLSDTSKAILSQIAAAPTPGELGELGFIDEFFAPGLMSGPGSAPGDGPYYASDLQAVICGGNRLQIGANFWNQPSPLWDKARALAANPFFCPPRPTIFKNFVLDYYMGGNEKFFGLDLSKTWGELRLQTLNIETLLFTTGNPVDPQRGEYAWPGVAKVEPIAWWEIEQSGLRNLIRQEGILTVDIARVWITLSIVHDYAKLVARAKARIKEEIRTAHTEAIVVAIGFAAIGAIIGGAIIAALAAPAATAVSVTASGQAVATEVAVPAAAATGSPVSSGAAVTTAIKYGTGLVTEAQKKEAVGSLNDAASQLQSNDPGFAGEVQWTAGYIDRLMKVASAEQEAARAQAPGGGSDPLTAAVGIGLPAALSVGISLLRK